MTGERGPLDAKQIETRNVIHSNRRFPSARLSRGLSSRSRAFRETTTWTPGRSLPSGRGLLSNLSVDRRPRASVPELIVETRSSVA